jgi:glycine hydroxymethyltransferase
VIGLPQTGTWQCLDHVIDPRTLRIDLKALARNAQQFKPNLIVAGSPGYPRSVDYVAFRQIADLSGAVLMADLAQTCALVAAGVAPSPFAHCDVVVATAQKSSRTDLIFYRQTEVAKRIVSAFREEPGIPQMAAIAVAMKEVATPEFKTFQYAAVRNMQRLANYLVRNDIPLVTGGTDFHVAEVELEKEGLDGESAQCVLDGMNITTTARATRLILSSPALTQRGLKEEDFEQVGEFLIKGLKIAKELRKKHPGDTFRQAATKVAGVDKLKTEVVAFARQFPLTGRA